MLRNPDPRRSLEREIAQARDAGLEGRDLLQALVITFPDAPLKDVLAALQAAWPTEGGEPGPGQALREIYGAETMPPAALDGADPRIAIFQKVALGFALSQASETHQEGVRTQLHAGLDGLRLLGIPLDLLAPTQQHIAALDFSLHGLAALAALRERNPVAYLRFDR